jgi:hypothetical protein
MNDATIRQNSFICVGRHCTTTTVLGRGIKLSSQMGDDIPVHLPLDQPEDRSLVKPPEKNPKRADPLLRFDAEKDNEGREPIKKTPSNFDVLNTDPKVETVKKQVSVLKIEKENSQKKKRCVIS